MNIYEVGEKKIVPGAGYVEVWGAPGDDPEIVKVEYVGYPEGRMKVGFTLDDKFGDVTEITPLRILDDYLINAEFEIIYGQEGAMDTFSIGLNPTTNLILKKIKSRVGPGPADFNIFLFVIKQTNKPNNETTAIEFTYGRQIKYYHELQAIYYAYTDKILPWKKDKLSRIGLQK